MARDPMQTKLDSLQDRIFANADAELAREIEEILARVEQHIPIGPFEYLATDAAQSAQKIRVTATRSEIMSVLAAQMFNARQATARRRAVADFLERVERKGTQP